ncbi:MAG: spore cortex biosynthesis protein YabQ [Clostridia bacterium]|nr:spore cortex biosynthesis protein YabQ [Clostridia bacterium]
MILYETANQPAIFLWCLGLGFFCGLLFDFFNIFCFLCKNNKIVRFFCDFLAIFCCFLLNFLICKNLNFGEFRLYIIVTFFIALFAERLSLGKIVAKSNLWCYNIFCKLTDKFKRKPNGTKEKEK